MRPMCTGGREQCRDVCGERKFDICYWHVQHRRPLPFHSGLLLSYLTRTGRSCASQPLIVEYPSIEDDDVKRERELVVQSEETLHVADQVQCSEGDRPYGRGILRFVNVRKVFRPKQRGDPANVAVADLCLDV